MSKLEQHAIADNLKHLQALSDDLFRTWQQYQSEPHNSERKSEARITLSVSSYAIAAEISAINDAGYVVILKSRESGPEYRVACAVSVGDGDRLTYSEQVKGFGNQTVYLHYVRPLRIEQNDLPTSD